MVYIEIIGFLAGTLTTIAFVPQVIKAWRSKHTKDISLITFIALSTGMFLWLIYGILINSFPIMGANAISLILGLTILSLKLKYG